jgi:hypothetical protein
MASRAARSAFAKVMSSPGGRALTGGGLQISVSVVGRGVSDPIQRIAAIAPTVAREIDVIIGREAQTAVERIQAKWPVDTGASRSGFSVVRSAPFRYQIVNPVNYSGYVHRRGSKAVLAETLVPAELERARARIVQEVLAALKRVATGIGSAAIAARPTGVLGRVRSFFGF